MKCRVSDGKKNHSLCKPLKLRSLCNAQIKKKMLIQNSVPSISQTADLSPNQDSLISYAAVPDTSYYYLCKWRANLLGQNACNYILTSLWKSNTYTGRLTDYVKGEMKNIYLHHLIHMSWDPCIMSHRSEFYWGHIWILDCP